VERAQSSALSSDLAPACRSGIPHRDESERDRRAFGLSGCGFAERQQNSHRQQRNSKKHLAERDAEQALRAHASAKNDRLNRKRETLRERKKGNTRRGGSKAAGLKHAIGLNRRGRRLIITR